MFRFALVVLATLCLVAAMVEKYLGIGEWHWWAFLALFNNITAHGID